MNSTDEFAADPAAIFACANSLWEACRRATLNDPSLDLSAAYHGWDQLMREVMRIGETFEKWCCNAVDYTNFSEVWPYMMGDRFGSACLEVLSATELASFGERDCLRVSLRLGLPVKQKENLPVPVDVIARNPVHGAAFMAFRVQTVRFANDRGDLVPFTLSDDPFDEGFSAPFLGVYGIEMSKEMEHIADRPTYASAVDLVRKLAPGIQLPKNPTVKP